MKTKLWAVCLMVCVTFFTSTAQVLYKKGTETLEFNILSIITNYYLISGFMLYVIGAVLMIVAFKGGELSVLYPIVATSYIWVGIFSYFIFHDSLNYLRWIGIFSIFFGVIAVGVGSKVGEMIPEAL